MLNEDAKTLEQARLLWQKYFSLTKELLKFSDQKDSDLFIELLISADSLSKKFRHCPQTITGSPTNAKP